MAEKNSEKKLLAILVVLIVLVLVIELLSLNVLYGLANNSNFEGQLASYDAYAKPPDPYCVSECETCKAACLTEQCKRDCAGGDKKADCDKYCKK